MHAGLHPWSRPTERRDQRDLKLYRPHLQQGQRNCHSRDQDGDTDSVMAVGTDARWIGWVTAQRDWKRP